MSRLAVASFCLAAVGCASVSVEPASWPAGLPPRAYYESTWEAASKDRPAEPFEQYLAWVVRFYRGAGLVPGWTSLQEKLTAGLEPDEAGLLAPRLSCLAQTISAEWARPNEQRRVSSEMLRTWGRFLQQAKGQGKAIAAADRVLADVTAPPRGELEPAAISADRYRDTIATAGP